MSETADEARSALANEIDKRGSVIAVLKATWPLMVIGVLLFAIALARPWMDARLCAPAAGSATLACPAAYKLILDRSILTSIGVALLGLPLIIAFYADKVMKGFTGIVIKLFAAAARAPDVLREQIQTGQIGPADVRALLKDCIRYYDGRDNNARGVFGAYIDATLDGLGVGDEARFRSNYKAAISIVPVKGPLAARYHKWSESIGYTVEGRKGQLYPLRTTARIACAEAELSDALDNWGFTIRTGREIFSFADTRKAINDKSLASIAKGRKFEKDGVDIQWANGLLTIIIERKIPLESDRMGIKTQEDSYIALDDRDYTLAMEHPTRGVQLSLRVPDTFRIVTKSFSPTSINIHAKCEIGEEGATALLDHDGWFMPGLASVLAWTSRV